jgi:hypothetical protein
MDDKIVVFESYNDPVLANIIKTRLVANGIQCFLTDENIIGVQPFYNLAVGGVKLHVFERDIKKIKSILDETVDLGSPDPNENKDI